MKTLLFFSGVCTGFALFTLFHWMIMPDVISDWQWRLEQEQAAHLDTAKELQELRASVAAGLNVNF